MSKFSHQYAAQQPKSPPNFESIFYCRSQIREMNFLTHSETFTGVSQCVMLVVADYILQFIIFLSLIHFVSPPSRLQTLMSRFDFEILLTLAAKAYAPFLPIFLPTILYAKKR